MRITLFQPLWLSLGLRYTRARQRNHFISFIALSSMLGIALGVMVLITVLSVMNGFDEAIHQRFFGMAPEITITGMDDHIYDWQKLAKTVQEVPEVLAIAPYVGGQGLLTHQGQVLPLVVTGIDPRYEEKIDHLKDKLLAGKMQDLSHFGMFLGRALADQLGVVIGDKITLMVPQATVTPAGLIPRFKRFRVAGIFSAGSGFNFDTRLAFIHIDDAQKLFQLGQAVSGIKIKIKEVYRAPALSAIISGKIGRAYKVGDWTDQFGAFFQAVKMEKTMMFLILILIIAVAAFNLVSSLVMVVHDKQAEIAILRTMGATPGLILRIFMAQGMIIGCVGTLLGLIGGILLASHATQIVDTLQSWLGIQILSANVYFVDYLPSKIESADILKVCAIALGMSFVATLYPAWRASKTIITQALYHE
ncbi:MAG: lipoprotein-releasing ABC transporter permease subunit [Legionellaceae bacterium]|nr:lipoprotein-releasing ABC transporter permease subunit [Legionellaceae bacterium]